MPGDNSSSSSTSAVSGLRNDTNASNNWKTKKIEQDATERTLRRRGCGTN